MDREDILVELSGQAINGLLSSNSSWLSKFMESSMHSQIADIAIKIAKDMTDKIIEEREKERSE